MGTLIDRMQQDAKSPSRIRCTVCQKLTDPDAGEAIATALEIGVPYASISRILAEEGIYLAAGTLSRHDRGECTTNPTLGREGG